MPLWDRPNGPTSGAAAVATSTNLNVQAALAGPLPALQIVAVTTEVKILSPVNAAVALTVQLPPDTGNEQTVLDLMVSGFIKTTNTTNISLGLYGDALATVTAGNLLHKTAAAVAQNTATAPFYYHAQLIYDSVSGKLHGKGGGMINNVIDPEIAFTNVLTGLSNTANPVLNLSFTITSSAATGPLPTTINVQKFSVG